MEFSSISSDGSKTAPGHPAPEKRCADFVGYRQKNQTTFPQRTNKKGATGVTLPRLAESFLAGDQ